MHGIILFAHGSLLCGAGQTLLKHAERLRNQGLAPVVEVGYLNYSEPPFLEVVERCVAQGVTEIIVTPYFLVPGKFVRVDIPQAVAEAQERFPQMLFRVAEAIGFEERLAEALIQSAKQGRPPEEWGRDVEQATAFCRPAEVCPLYQTPFCPKAPGERNPQEEVQ
jgi:sirohydrochlorin ferrochelatase